MSAGEIVLLRAQLAEANARADRDMRERASFATALDHERVRVLELERERDAAEARFKSEVERAGLLQIELTKERDKAIRSTLCEVIDRIGGDAYAGMNRTEDELRQQFWDTYTSLQEREILAALELAAKLMETGVATFTPAPFVGKALADGIRALAKSGGR